MSFSLRGQFLVAMPDMEDERFSHTVVYICSHSEEDGAMGLVVNKLMPDLHFADLMAQFDIKITEEDEPENSAYDQPIVVGGPVETSRGFVLHTADFETPDNSINISDDLCLSTTMDVLKSIADGDGPSHALLALGYCGWEPGQLEDEISENGWLKHLVFLLYFGAGFGVRCLGQHRPLAGSSRSRLCRVLARPTALQNTQPRLIATRTSMCCTCPRDS